MPANPKPVNDRLNNLRTISEKSDFPASDPTRINMHMHTSFSFNAFNWSPSDIAFQARKMGFHAAGIIDFDVLDGLHEFIKASEILELRSTVGIETRTFNDLYSGKEIDSPGEPGISYISGTGLINIPEGSDGDFLHMLKSTAKKRNETLISRINAQLREIAVDYENGVLPMTPAGNATERHIVKAYIRKSKEKFTDVEEQKKFWSKVLGINITKLPESLADPGFENKVRARLAKRGGIGYVQPTAESFPKTKDVFEWLTRCGGIPVESWLDGTSEGENDPFQLLENAYSLGARALNIIPDRNWNIQDKTKQKIKYQNLKQIIESARSLQMPIMIGTELNKTGQPLYDDIGNPFLKPFANDFLTGANVIIGHNILSRFAGVGYCGEKAEYLFQDNIKKKNLFFSLVGALPPVGTHIAEKLNEKGEKQAFDIISDSIKQGNWKL